MDDKEFNSDNLHFNFKKRIFAQAVIYENDYNLSVSSYVEVKDMREQVDVTQLNEEIALTVEKINQLRADIDKIVMEIEN